VGASEGLAYLHHDCNPRIIHRDIKSSNILIDENFEARLSDFGIAKCLSTTRTHASTSVVGTIGYIDPEYARSSRLNEKSDVYSFGIVLLELLTGKKAVDNDSNLHHLVSVFCIFFLLIVLSLIKQNSVCNNTITTSSTSTRLCCHPKLNQTHLCMQKNSYMI